MYVCVCNAITEDDLKNGNVEGLGSTCGKCVMKVVINDCKGGFYLSGKAKKLLGMPHAASEWWEKYGDRHDTKLVDVVEELGSDASQTVGWGTISIMSNLVIVEIPDDSTYLIDSSEGKEAVVVTSQHPIVCPPSIHAKSLYKSLKRD
jgi:hypothetical protein